MVVYRGGERERINAVIAGEERTVASNDTEQGRSLNDPVFNGAQLRTLDPASAAVAAAGVRSGVEVVDVDQRSRAWQAGLRPGDVIYEVNRDGVDNLREFNESVSEPAPVVALSVVRENRRMLVIIS